MPADRPWWEPELTDAAWCQKMRKEYDLGDDYADEDVRDDYADGLKYTNTWDNLGDAAEEYEKLADAYLELKNSVKVG